MHVHPWTATSRHARASRVHARPLTCMAGAGLCARVHAHRCTSARCSRAARTTRPRCAQSGACSNSPATGPAACSSETAAGARLHVESSRARPRGDVEGRTTSRGESERAVILCGARLPSSRAAVLWWCPRCGSVRRGAEGAARLSLEIGLAEIIVMIDARDDRREIERQRAEERSLSALSGLSGRLTRLRTAPQPRTLVSSFDAYLHRVTGTWEAQCYVCVRSR